MQYQHFCHDVMIDFAVVLRHEISRKILHRPCDVPNLLDCQRCCCWCFRLRLIQHQLDPSPLHQFRLAKISVVAAEVVVAEALVVMVMFGH